jgi:putative protease
MSEEKIGTVSHYYGHIGVATVVLEGPLKVGDTIHIKGHTSDFTQKVDSIQIEHKNVDRAGPGDSIGIRVAEHARVHDTVNKVVED